MLMISGLKLQQNGKLEQFYNDDKSEVSEVVKTPFTAVLNDQMRFITGFGARSMYSRFIGVLFLLNLLPKI